MPLHKTNVLFLPLKLTATYNFYYLCLELTINETARKSWNVPSPTCSTLYIRPWTYKFIFGFRKVNRCQRSIEKHILSL